MTAVSIGPIVTNSATKPDSRLEGTCIKPDRSRQDFLRFSRGCDDGGGRRIFFRGIRPRHKIELARHQHDRGDPPIQTWQAPDRMGHPSHSKDF
jgi:hypothetical protein